MNRPWGGRNHCGGPRAAAEPVADVAVLTVEPGPAFVTRLREAFRKAPDAKRFLIHTNNPPPPGKALDFPPPFAGERRVGVVTIPITDTVKEVVGGRVSRTVPRDTLVQVTGPWAFDREALADALVRVDGREAQVAGMIDLCEVAQVRVRVLPGR